MMWFLWKKSVHPGGGTCLEKWRDVGTEGANIWLHHFRGSELIFFYISPWQLIFVFFWQLFKIYLLGIIIVAREDNRMQTYTHTHTQPKTHTFRVKHTPTQTLTRWVNHSKSSVRDFPFFDFSFLYFDFFFGYLILTIFILRFFDFLIFVRLYYSFPDFFFSFLISYFSSFSGFRFFP